MPECPNGHPVPAGKRFCGQCGIAVPQHCRNGHLVADGKPFCGQCGAPVDIASGPEEPSSTRRPRRKLLIVATAVTALLAASLIGALVLVNGNDESGNTAAGPATTAVTSTSTTTASTTSTFPSTTATTEVSTLLSTSGECDARSATDTCEPSCQAALAAMSVGTNPAMSDALVYEFGYVRLELADGSDPEPEVDYQIRDYAVELLARYPDDFVGHTRWALPGPGETNLQSDPNSFGIVLGDGDEVTGPIESDPLATEAQFTVSGGRCLANDAYRP